MANCNSNTVSVINTTTNTVIATVTSGSEPSALGQFISQNLIIPTIAWSDPSDIGYGTVLNSTQLDATA